MNPEYIPPKFKGDAFNCPNCKAYAHQEWAPIYFPHKAALVQYSKDSFLCFCNRCEKPSIWIHGNMILPRDSVAPFPSVDMPSEVKADFEEARLIINMSPRGAAALLRLALQKLMVSLGEKGKDLDSDIGNLVKRGLDDQIKNALDIIRVIGNNAVHPGQIDLKDDQETALALFDIMNVIVDNMITKPKKIKELHQKLPKSAIEHIEKRDS